MEDSVGSSPKHGPNSNTKSFALASPSRINGKMDSNHAPSVKDQGMKEFEFQNEKFTNLISDLDIKLNRVLKKQEFEYLQAYSVYVKRKEKELRKLIGALDAKNSNNNCKDLRISQLEVTIDQMRKDAFAYEQKQEALIQEIKQSKEKLKVEQEEKEFFHKQALDAKRKNKLLKVAIGRLQVEREDVRKASNQMLQDVEIHGDEKDTDTFLTNAHVDDKNKTEVDNFENSQALVEQNLMNNAKYAGRKQKINQSMQFSQKGSTSYSHLHKRTQSQGYTKYSESRYRNIPSENLKFQQFIDLIFESTMQIDDIKFEIISWVQAQETNYNDAIQEHKLKCERFRTQLRKEKAKHVNDVIEKGDLENLFVDCVEDVRRNVIKRRLKAEIIGKKKIGKFDQNSQEAREFEESLLKLATLAKDRVKFSEFTSQDRNNLLDLFVNNEKTLLKIYEILFPKKNGGTQYKTNSLKQISALKNSSDTIRIGQKSEFLKGDSMMQRSVDETQAGTDLLQNSTILPSILPAMNSIQSNDIINTLGGGKSTQVHAGQSPNMGNMEPFMDNMMMRSAVKPPHHGKNMSLAVGNLNQRSVNMMQ